jgi:hypothetical protein
MRIDENTNHYLYCLYEGGVDYETLCNILEIRHTYDRQKARELIRGFVYKFCKEEDNKHPLLTLHPLQTRELIEMLQQDSKGSSINLFPDGPSVW